MYEDIKNSIILIKMRHIFYVQRYNMCLVTIDQYGLTMYYKSVLQKHLPLITLLAIGTEEWQCDNELLQEDSVQYWMIIAYLQRSITDLGKRSFFG